MSCERVGSAAAVGDHVAQLVHRGGRRAEQGERPDRWSSRAPHRGGILGLCVLFRGVQARLLAGFAALLMVAPASAFANGDPASDALLQSKEYFPATKRVSVEAANQLKAIVQKANALGYPIRVALIEDPTDLGTVPDLLMQPQKYAQFLGPEIRFAYKGDLLVVMPNGLGITSTDETSPPAKAIEGMQIEAGGSPDGGAQTAGEAGTKPAAAAGHPIGTKKKGGGGGGGGGGGVIAAGGLGVRRVGGGP